MNRMISVSNIVLYGLITCIFVALFFINEHLLSIDAAQRAMDIHSPYYPVDSSMIMFVFIFVIIVTRIAQWSLHRRQGHTNNALLVGFGFLLYGASVLLALDTALLEGWGVPGRCGEGFSRGNCFLMDGLGTALYPIIIPALFMTGTALFIINHTIKSKNN